MTASKPLLQFERFVVVKDTLSNFHLLIKKSHVDVGESLLLTLINPPTLDHYIV